MSLAMNMAFLTLAIVTLAVRTLDYTSSSNTNAGVSMAIPITHHSVGTTMDNINFTRGKNLDHPDNTDTNGQQSLIYTWKTFLSPS